MYAVTVALSSSLLTPFSSKVNGLSYSFSGPSFTLKLIAAPVTVAVVSNSMGVEIVISLPSDTLAVILLSVTAAEVSVSNVTGEPSAKTFCGVAAVNNVDNTITTARICAIHLRFTLFMLFICLSSLHYIVKHQEAARNALTHPPTHLAIHFAS